MTIAENIQAIRGRMAAAAEALRSAGAVSVVCAALAAPDLGGEPEESRRPMGEILKTNRELQLFSCKIK